MSGKRTRLLVLAASGCLISLAHLAAAETPITNKHDIDAHFEVATKDFGEGVVQLHSKQVGADGTRHLVHSFDCANKTYVPVYADDNSPDGFPLESLGFTLEPIDETSVVAPLAQHACNKHGYPLLEW